MPRTLRSGNARLRTPGSGQRPGPFRALDSPMTAREMGHRRPPVKRATDGSGCSARGLTSGVVSPRALYNTKLSVYDAFRRPSCIVSYSWSGSAPR